jgi:transcription antitermination factor NusB
MGDRRRARELALQVLFHLEFTPDDPGEAFELVCGCFESKEAVRAFARRLVLGICLERKTLDRLISKASRNWRMERMAHVDKTILRLATYEMLFMEDIPPRVSLDEAVEVGKKFGTEDSGKYVNGVLDNIYASIKEKKYEIQPS